MLRSLPFGMGVLAVAACLCAAQEVPQEDAALLRVPGSGSSLDRSTAQANGPGPRPTTGNRKDEDRWLFELQQYILYTLPRSGKVDKAALTPTEKAEITHAADLIAMASEALAEPEVDWGYVYSALWPLASLTPELPEVAALCRKVMHGRCTEIQAYTSYEMTVGAAVGGLYKAGAEYYEEFMGLLRPEAWTHVTCGADPEKLRALFRSRVVRCRVYVLPPSEARALLARVRTEYADDAKLLECLEYLDDQIDRREQGRPPVDIIPGKTPMP